MTPSTPELLQQALQYRKELQEQWYAKKAELSKIEAEIYMVNMGIDRLHQQLRQEDEEQES